MDLSKEYTEATNTGDLTRIIALETRAMEEAYIEACERVSPNAHEFDDLCESIYQQIIGLQ